MKVAPAANAAQERALWRGPSARSPTRRQSSRGASGGGCGARWRPRRAGGEQVRVSFLARPAAGDGGGPFLARHLHVLPSQNFGIFWRACDNSRAGVESHRAESINCRLEFGPSSLRARRQLQGHCRKGFCHRSRIATTGAPVSLADAQDCCAGNGVTGCHESQRQDIGATLE